VPSGFVPVGVEAEDADLLRSHRGDRVFDHALNEMQVVAWIPGGREVRFDFIKPGKGARPRTDRVGPLERVPWRALR
jgi:hypothetical protein